MWSDCKPEGKFQYGGRLFSETGSGNNSAVDICQTSAVTRH